MAATAFQVYNKAKKAIGGGVVQLGTTAMRLKLATSASNASTLGLSTFGSITNEIAAAGGYVAGGRSLASLVWTVGASAKQYKYAAANLVFTAVGAPLVNVKYAIVGVAGGACVCFCQLSSAQFTVPTGQTLTVAFSSQGIFVLV